MRARMEGPEVTAPGDDRVTWLGALMRKTSIDELPQMLNVLLGHMTLVGPRPESVALARRYPEELRFIFRYRPGVTGPCQVLVRDEKVLGWAADVEKFYLTKLLPHRVDKDLDLPEGSDPGPHRPVAGHHVPLPVHTAKPAARRGLSPSSPGPRQLVRADRRLRPSPNRERLGGRGCSPPGRAASLPAPACAEHGSHSRETAMAASPLSQQIGRRDESLGRTYACPIPSR